MFYVFYLCIVVSFPNKTLYIKLCAQYCLYDGSVAEKLVFYYEKHIENAEDGKLFYIYNTLSAYRCYVSMKRYWKSS